MQRLPMRLLPLTACLVLLVPLAASAQEPEKGDELRPPSAFESIADPQARSVALFEEAGKVILHPRCVNCHPPDDMPRQGLEKQVHQPPVQRGEGGMGVPGMQCVTCHGAENARIFGQAEDIRSIPGHPEWHLAPIEMAWLGVPLGAICEQIKDPARNGGKSLEKIVEHMAHDSLVGWGWAPGEGRQPAPGNQEVFGALIAAWVETGAACPAAR